MEEQKHTKQFKTEENTVSEKYKEIYINVMSVV